MVGMSKLLRTCSHPDPAWIYLDSLGCVGNNETGIGYWGFRTLRGSRRRKTIHNIFLFPFSGLSIHHG